MIQLLDASLSFGGQTILNGVTWALRDGLRLGLVGPNGAGKTTLLKVLAGRQRLDGGLLDVPGGTTLGYLEQDTQEALVDRSVRDEALEAFRHILDLERREIEITHELDADDDHESDAYHKLLAEMDRVHSALLSAEAHTLRPRTDAVLTGLGFSADDLDRPLRTFSGGWRMRVALARLLLQQPDVLLLDEPTNHLDIDSIGWLEQYLKGYAGTVVVVSHDRTFLDRMVSTTAELVQGRLTEYAGNYTFYLTARAERRIIQQSAYDNQQREIAQMERFVERFRAKATKAAQAQSRVKALDRMDRLDAPPEDAPTVHFRFPMPERSGKVVIELSDFSKSYDGEEGRVEVFREADALHVERGSKVALIGRNGAGKSTLARILRGAEPFEGTLTLGHKVTMTYFAQHQADELDPEVDILGSLRAVGKGQTETALRSLAGTFLFKGDDVYKPVGVLSGGERARVALARAMLTPANVLILDEPTNHLDMASIAVLVEALRAYEGTFVVVSHDRHFLDRVATEIWRVEDGGVQIFPGTYAEYMWAVENGTQARAAGGSGSAAAPASATVGGRITAPGTTGPLAPTGTSDAGARPGGGKKTKDQKRAEAEARNAAFRSGQGSTGSAQNSAATASKAAAPTRAVPSGDGAATPAATPSALSPGAVKTLRRTHAETEARIEALEGEKATLETRLADPALYADAGAFRTATEAHARVSADLDRLYAVWEQSASALATVG